MFRESVLAAKIMVYNNCYSNSNYHDIIIDFLWK